MEDTFTIVILWLGSIVAGVMIGRDEGRLAEGIALTALMGVIGVILLAVLPSKTATGSGPTGGASSRAKPLPIQKVDHPRGYMTCGCAVLCALGLLPLFFGIGFGGGGAYTFTDVIFFGSILAVPAAVCTYSGLSYFGVSEAYAKMWAVIVFSLMLGATWLFLDYIAVESRRLRGF